MTQFRKDTQQFLDINKSIYEVVMTADKDGDIVGYKNAYGKPVLAIDDDTVQHTSKNRRKISSFEIIDYCTFQYDKQEDVWDEVAAGNANSTFNEYLGMVDLNVGANAGDEIIRQTKQVIRYVPGRQNEVSMAAIFHTPTAGIRRRFGIFDEHNGAFFEDGGDGTYYVVIRRNTASGVVEQRIARGDWNVDRLDGSGPSGITANPMAVQLMVIEYEWYGAGQVEFKFIINNNAYAVHQFNHANLVPNSWASTPFLPIRVELTNVTGESSGATFTHGSHSMLSEGDVGPLGRDRTVATDTAGYTLSTANVFYPVVNIRLKSSRLGGVVIPHHFTAATLNNTNIFFKIISNATINGGTWVSASNSSHVEYNLTATGMSGGNVLQAGFITSGNMGQIYKLAEDSITQLARRTTTTLADTSDVYTIAIASSSSNKSSFASMTWIEVR